MTCCKRRSFSFIPVTYCDMLQKREEIRAAGRTSDKKAFAFCRTTGKKVFAAPQARRFLPHHRQEGFCRTTGKKVFAAPQARRFLPHHRQEGFCRTTGKRALPHLRREGFVASQWANNILAAPDKSISPSHR